MEETKLQRILMELRTDLDMLLERYYSGATKEMQEKLSSLSTLVTELQTKVETLDSDNTTNKTDIESIKADIVNIKSKCEEFTTNIANLQSSVTQNSSDITDLTTRVTTAETDIDDLQTLTASHTETLNDHWDKMMLLLAEAISMTTKMSNAEERITALENSSATGNPEISKADITALQTQVDALETEVDSLSTKVTTNTTNIADLTSRVNTNTTNIATNTADIVLLKTTTENISSTVSELQTTVATNTQNISNLQSTISTNTTNIQTNTDNISALQSQVNTNTENIATTTANIATNTANITTNTTNIATLMAFRDSLLTPPDPYYNPKTFSDYPAGTILQGYAKYSRTLIKTSSRSDITSPIMIFRGEENSSATVKIKCTFTFPRNVTLTLKLFLNDEVVATKTTDVINGSNLLLDEFQGIVLSEVNKFKYQIVFGSSYIATSGLFEMEVIAPNVEIINQLSPFCVEAFMGKYYLADCTSGTAKIAEINADEMHNMNNLTWVDTNINCNRYCFGFGIDDHGELFDMYGRNDFYYRNDGEIVFINKETDEEVVISSSTQIIDWFSNYTKNIGLLERTKDKNYDSSFLGRNSLARSSLETFECYDVSASKFGEQFRTMLNIRFGVFTLPNGNTKLASINVSPNKYFDSGFGTHNHLYIDSHQTTYATLSCYSKYFDKIIKRKYNYEKFTGFSLASTEEIGAYEEYFEGVNNDYFVVKNGVLEYHKKVTTSNATSSTQNN